MSNSSRAIPVLCLALALGALGACASDRGGVAAPRGGSSGFVTKTDAWHADRIERLTAPDGWLSLVALDWLVPGRNRVGNDPDAEVSYPGLPGPHVGTIVVEDSGLAKHGGLRFEPAEGFEVGGVPADGRLASDADGEPTVLALGDIRFHVVMRGGRPAVRMKDAAAPTRTGFDGIERFAASPDWRVLAEFAPADDGATIDLDTVIGVPTEAQVAGHARFAWNGHAVEAVLFKSGKGSLLRFADATNGESTYGAGRYLSVDAPVPLSTSPTLLAVELDFNRAFNPPCAFTDFATCSVPPPSNRFPFPVTAGERWDR